MKISSRTSDLEYIDQKPKFESTPLDVTAVHEDQLSWGEDIKHRPGELLFFHRPTAENVSKKEIGCLECDGKVLLDFRGEPLRDFPNLPLVISSHVEGWRVEAWLRADARMHVSDITARLPVKWARNPAGQRVPMPIYGDGTIRERATKFRNKAGLITWTSKGDPKIEKFMDELRTPTERRNNLTTSRNLTRKEQGSMKEINLGTRPDRAQAGRDPGATQRYKDSVERQADETYDFDCRAERPETPAEIQTIQNALQQTYSDFVSYTNVPLEMPNTQDSYLDQWNCMQVQLNRIWARGGTKKMEPPQLYALGKWTVSFDNWVSAPQAYLTYVQN